METKKRALGKGLEQLFNNENLDLNSFEQEIIDSSQVEDVTNINLTEIRPNPYQPRKVFDETALKELAESIKEYGVIQPIIVKKSIRGYEIVAGERRYRASKLAKKESIPAIVRDFSDEQMMEIALLENLQRANLSAIEEALAYKNLIDKLMLTQEKLAEKLGKSRSHITNMLGLLRLPQDVQDLVNNNKLTMAHARLLSKLENENQIHEMVDKIINNKISVRNTETMINQENPEKKVKIERKSKNKNNEYKYVEELLKEKLDSKVKITDKKIEISFTSNADLNRILEIINIKE